MSKLKELKIKLDEDDFRCLISGGILTIKSKEQEIMIYLSDIGFHRMDLAISDVDSGKLSPYSHLTKELK